MCDNVAFAKALFNDEWLIVAQLSDNLHRAVLRRLPIILNGVVIVDHENGQESVPPAGENLEDRVLRYLYVGRGVTFHELRGQLERRGKQALLVVEEAVVVKAAVGVCSDEK